MKSILFCEKVLLATFLMFALFSSYELQAQVTIGSAEAPMPGALLQLKEPSTANQGEANSTKGLLLPRVKLTSLTSLDDIEKDASENSATYTGLVVYNVNETAVCGATDLTKGIYIWNGTTWQSLGGTKLISRRKELVDNRPGDTPQTYGTVHLQLVRPWDGGVVFDAGEWMMENLRARVFSSNITPVMGQPTFINSDSEHVVGRPEMEYGNYDQATFSTRGYYYNTYTVFNGINMPDQDVNEANYVAPSRIQQGICPEGWRVPTYEDWKALSTAIANDNYCYFTKPYDPAITYQRMDGIFSHQDEIFKSIMGYRGKSRSLEEGGFNGFAEGPGQSGKPSASFWQTFPSPWSTYLSPFASPIYLEPEGVGTVVQMGSGQTMPVRCVKGTAPAQIKYDPRWNHFLPNN